MSGELKKYKVDERNNEVWMNSLSGWPLHDDLTVFNKRIIINNGKENTVLICRNCEEILGQITDENIEHQSEYHCCITPGG